MVKHQFSLFSFTLQKLKPYKKWFALTLFTRLLWAFQTSLSPYLLKMIMDEIASFAGNQPELIGHIWPLLLICMGLWLMVSFCYRIWDYVEIKLYPALRGDVAMHMYTYLTGHSNAYFQQNMTGSLQNKITDITFGVYKLVKQSEEGVGMLAMIAIALTTLSLRHPLFGLILLGWFLFFVATFFLFSGKIRQTSTAFSVQRTRYLGNISDTLSNIVNMRLFARRGYEVEKTQEKVHLTNERHREMGWITLKLRFVWDMSMVLTIGLMLFLLIRLYMQERLTIGDFSFVIQLTLSVFMHVWWFFAELQPIFEQVGRGQQALTILQQAHGLQDEPDAQVLQVKKGEIMVENITFAYEKEKNIFKDKSVRITAGEKVGLVGFSGGGKTTFANLILRLFDPQKGKITIDGQDISAVTQDSLRENISMIPQDTSLFHRSLMKNIRYGRLDATDEEVIEASKKAFCHEFIDALPKKYDTLAGERGIKFSGGQRQRIAVARAILKDAPILILDEATSALDSVTEHALQKSFDTLMKGRTTIVIAHRLSTLAAMDRILVFEEGKIIEEGSHNALLTKKGAYERMWKMQAGGFMPTEKL